MTPSVPRRGEWRVSGKENISSSRDLYKTKVTQHKTLAWEWGP